METFSIVLIVIAKFCSTISWRKGEISSTASTQIFSALIDYAREEKKN